MEDIDALVDEQMMKERDELVRKTMWIQIINAPTYKRYRAADNEHFFKDEVLRDDGSFQAGSSYYYYPGPNNSEDPLLGGYIRDEFRNFIC